MYFKKFPIIYYEYKMGDKIVLKTIRDITSNVRFRKQILANITLFDEYDMRDGDTPEIIAAKYYGSAEYHWVVMLCNERFDWENDFPLRQPILEEFINRKYVNPYGTHHYEDEAGNIVDSTYPSKYPVSNYEYEDRLNESKRRIKLIDPSTLSQILTQFKSLI